MDIELVPVNQKDNHLDVLIRKEGHVLGICNAVPSRSARASDEMTIPGKATTPRPQPQRQRLPLPLPLCIFLLPHDH